MTSLFKWQNIGSYLFRKNFLSPQFARIVSLFTKNRINFTFISADNVEHEIEANVGQTIQNAVAEYDRLDINIIYGACDGQLNCGTCCVILEENIYKKIPAIKEEEEWIMDERDFQTPRARLGCQVLLTKEMNGMTVRQSKIARIFDQTS